MNIMIMLKNNFLRVFGRKGYAPVSLALTFVLIMVAVFFSSQLETKGHIGIVGGEGLVFSNTDVIQISYLDEVPPKSALVMNRYHAVAVPSADGWDILTVRNEEFSNMVETILIHGELPEGMTSHTRPVGVTVLGFLNMFIFMQGFIFMCFFREDKEIGTLKRTVTSSVSLESFLAAHVIFNFSFMYGITLAVIGFCKLLGMDLGFSYLQYAGMLALITFLATAFALFMLAAVEKEDSALALAGIIVVASPILSGSIYSLPEDNQILQTIGSLLPQKSFLDIADGLYRGAALREYLPEFVHILALAVGLVLAARFITKSRFDNGCYL